jgi:hypothetical protein
MNMSRLFTLLGRQSGYQGVLPVGRVQTPTLRLVVDRDRSIADFVRCRIGRSMCNCCTTARGSLRNGVRPATFATIRIAA